MKFLIIPVEHYENNVRVPAMWAECVVDVKEAEKLRKSLRLNTLRRILCSLL